MRSLIITNNTCKRWLEAATFIFCSLIVLSFLFKSSISFFLYRFLFFSQMLFLITVVTCFVFVQYQGEYGNFLELTGGIRSII